MHPTGPRHARPGHCESAHGVGAIEVRAHAKVNLCLAVAPPEPPGAPRAGWHRIASWFACVDLWDDVRLRAVPAPSPSGSTYLRRWADDAPRPSPIDWPLEKDLVWRAHRLLEQHVGRALPIELELVKRIPTGGGLGGGSSDAAAVLVALSALFDLPVSAAELRSLSARLGSDIAFFIPDRPGPAIASGPLHTPPPSAIVRGFGDVIEPAATITGPLTLILPDAACPTPAVYRAFDGGLAAGVTHEFREGDVLRTAARRAHDRPVSHEHSLDLFNDLTDPAIAVEPAVGRAIRALRDAGHEAHLSGSGSTLFVLGDAPVTPPPGCVCVRTRFV